MRVSRGAFRTRSTSFARKQRVRMPAAMRFPALLGTRPSGRVSMGSTERFAAAHRALGEATTPPVQNLFDERFGKLAEPMDAQTCARVLCEHHERIQRAKSVEGKRPWFDRIGSDRIYIRPAYRILQHEIAPERYLHSYRGGPIQQFREDLT